MAASGALSVTLGGIVPSFSAVVAQWSNSALTGDLGLSNARLAQQMSTLMYAWNNRESEFRNWVGGAKNGGPNGDGKYPLTNSLGQSSFVMCPAAIIDLVSGPASLASSSSSSALAAAQAASTSASSASVSATSATAAVIAAQSARDLAINARSLAQTAQSNAQVLSDSAATSAAAASSSQSLASASATSAAASATSASSSASSAAASAALAATFSPSLYVAKSGSTMTGPLILSSDPTSALMAATKQYVDNLSAASKAGARFTDDVTIYRSNDLDTGAIWFGNSGTHSLYYGYGAFSFTGGKLFVNFKEVWHAGNLDPLAYQPKGNYQTALGYTPVNKAGDSMAGSLTLSSDPTSALMAATKQYVDNGLLLKQAALGFTPVNKIGDSMTGPLSLCSNSISYDVFNGGIVLREVGLGGKISLDPSYAPGLTFLWSNVVSSQMYVDSIGEFHFGANGDKRTTKRTVHVNYVNLVGQHLYSSNGGIYFDYGINNVKAYISSDGLHLSDWLRIDGGTGVYWGTYGTGWYSVDSLYIRSYADKSVYAGAGSFVGASVKTPYGTQLTPRAYVRFQGRTTNGACVIDTSFNVASVQRAGPGSYVIYFSSYMPDANYAVNVNAQNSGETGLICGVESGSGYSTSACAISVLGGVNLSTGANLRVDPQTCSLSVFD